MMSFAGSWLLFAFLGGFLRWSSADWTYLPINIPEGPVKGLPKVIAQIQSNNKAVQEYTLSGVGVDQPDYDGKLRFRMDTSIVDSDVVGMIEQLNPLDRESKDVYTVIASALDSSGQKVESDIPLQIKVTDTNDNKPIFVISSLTGSVAEAADSSSPGFMIVKATDKDIGYNGEIVYSIVPGSDSPPSEAGGARFSVNSNTGQVSVVGVLDYETDPSVTFKVVATDGGGVQPGLETTATVTVNILDSNDHAPVIDDTPPKSVSELMPLDVSFYDIMASDVDEGVNKKVYFEIIDGNTAGTFFINSTASDTGKSMGELKLAKMLDFESGNTVYNLVIKAYNKEAANADNDLYASTTNVEIKVVDENEPPIFQNTPYNAAVTEEDVPAVESNTPLLKVTAKDIDFGSNQTVTYSIADDPEGWFRIDAATGDVYEIGKVDRESPDVSVEGDQSVYSLVVMATDNYDHGEKASSNSKVSIYIGDINDNPPGPDVIKGADEEGIVTICEKPENSSVTEITAKDPDSNKNGPPFTFRFDKSVSKEDWDFDAISATTQMVVTYVKDFDLAGGNPSMYELPYTMTDSGSPTQTGTATLTVSICRCSNGDVSDCTAVEPLAAGFPVAVVVALLVVLLLIIILILALISYRRRRDAATLKEPFFNDEDDVRENLQVYHEEGGEEDQDAYDLSALQAPLMDQPNAPIRVEKPLQAAPQPRMPRGIPDDIGDYIGEAKDQADSDPSAPPFDSLLVFDYEGTGSDAGSLSSINTATTDGSMDYDHLNDWGPRFKRLADMYNAGSESD